LRQQAEALVAELDQLSTGNLAVAADLTAPRERARLIPNLATQWGKLDGLVNNASVYRRNHVRDLDEEQIRSDYEINFFAPFLLMLDFARECRHGFIINLLDQRVARVEPGAGSYGLAKKSLRDATEAAAVEWAPEIRVNAVAPGIVLPPPGVAPEKLVPLLANVPMGSTSSGEEVAEACLYLATAETMTGQILYVDGGMHLANTVTPEKT
jgi:NAD(P)-dependent dehydrogenase (short-subunit alcohol dehydrogenase family)